MRKKALVVVLAVAILCISVSMVIAMPLSQDLSGYYKYGYSDGNTYAVRVEMAIGAIHCYIMPFSNAHYLGVIVGDKIIFRDRRNDQEWAVITQIDADTFLMTQHSADEGVIGEYTAIRITEEEANKIAERTKEDDISNTCVNNLKQLGLILHIFANEHDNDFPNSLAELYPEYATDRSVFVCPAHEGGFVDYDYDYEYIPGFRVGDPNPDQEAVIIERTGNHTIPGNTHHVLYLDGHVERRSD